MDTLRLSMLPMTPLDGKFVQKVKFDTSAVKLATIAFGYEPPEHLRWARLTIDLSGQVGS